MPSRPPSTGGGFGHADEEPEPSDAIEQIVVLGDPPGVKRFAIYCDESGTDGQPYYGFGSLWMADQRRGAFAKAMQGIRTDFPDRYGASEWKWNKVNHHNLRAYEALVEHFFRSHYLAFHCMIVERSWVDKVFHRGDRDLARRKHLTQFLANKIRKCLESHEGQETLFRVYADHPFAGSGYAKAHEAAEIVGGRLLAKVLGDLRPLDRVFPCDSKKRPAIQLCDVLLGAVLDAWNTRSSSAPKAQLRRHIAEHLGWADLDGDTMPLVRKFNIWRLLNPRVRGPSTTRPVSLKYPLPPIRRYSRR